MTKLLTVAEFTKIEGNDKFNTPQKVNYAIRKQGAPFEEVEGKRMIDPEKWSEWAANADITTRKAKSSGETGEVSAGRIQRKTGVTEGEFLAWKSGMDNEKISAGKVVTNTASFASTMIDDCGINAPLSWGSIERHIEDGKMMRVNYPEQLMYVLSKHYEGIGEPDTAKQLMELYERHKTEEARV